MRTNLLCKHGGYWFSYLSSFEFYFYGQSAPRTYNCRYTQCMSIEKFSFSFVQSKCDNFHSDILPAYFMHILLSMLSVRGINKQKAMSPNKLYFWRVRSVTMKSATMSMEMKRGKSDGFYSMGMMVKCIHTDTHVHEEKNMWTETSQRYIKECFRLWMLWIFL